ncbi:hypothetical protein RA086_01635 [Lactiplantibacillus sp. WILCCON 0030]|uniref:Integral membrane protein n=1 Tax=Lactiplantibacillus brownii TaxID=3069269 RepID=A0ABU1A5X7_9LACO|nr:hypothetical protein [Lactiplantibacillus brownii]MDQ7936354.1 hypothetical protein [Lactiplantibacillus brownii]
MSLKKTELRDYLVGFALVLTMVGVATWLHDYEIILPEIAALTTGMWIYHKQDWVRQPIKIFLAPSGTAVIGFVINLLPLNYPTKVVLTLLLILVLLRGLRSTLAPSFATGLLPIIVNATHWSFIVAIFAFTLILMAGVWLRGLHRGIPAGKPLNYRHMALFLAAGSLWTGLVWLSGNPQMAAIPPVLVVFFETLQQPAYGGKMALKHIVALSGAATIGVLVHLLFASWLLTTLISLPLVFILLTVLRLKLPAAYAFPLLALVLPANMFRHLPIAALLAASFFLGIVFVYKQVANRRRYATESE